ncbi:MAG: hypothetical protein H8E46_08145 [FCB group bacterium]|nr:hypothetical protein [FCB group bacterium]
MPPIKRKSEIVNISLITKISPGRLVRRKIDWLSETDDNNDVVLTTRVRRARNIEGYNFPARLKRKTSGEVFKTASEVVENSAFRAKSAVYRTDRLENISRSILMERRLIDHQPVAKKITTGIIVTRGESGFVNINYEDHLHFHSVSGGFNSSRALKRLDRITKPFKENLRFHSSRSLGYLTSSPVLLGTGFRISYYCHLPALNLLRRLDEITEKALTAGVVLSGNYYHESGFIGANIIQLYNQATLGTTENAIIEKTGRVVKEIIQSEREARKQIRDEFDPIAYDQISRFLAILKNAYILNADEMIIYLSALRFGILLGWISGIDSREILTLMLYAQDGHLCAAHKTAMDSIEKDKIRAATIKEGLLQVRMA